jgi:hypothetical protein
MKNDEKRNMSELKTRKSFKKNGSPLSMLNFKTVRLNAANVAGRVALTIGSTKLSYSLFPKICPPFLVV